MRSEPHKIVETKDYDNMEAVDLTPQDMSYIIGQMIFEARFLRNLKWYQVVALTEALRMMDDTLNKEI
jgi:hypothetical protein